MQLEFSNEQVQQLYEIVGRTQLQGAHAKVIVGLQTILEKAIQVEQNKSNKQNTTGNKE